MSSVPRSQFLQDIQTPIITPLISPNTYGGDNVFYEVETNTAETSTVIVNPTPFESLHVPVSSQITTQFVPSVIPVMENTTLTSIDIQRDPIERAVINDLVEIAKQVNNRSNIELLLLEKLNMVLSYLQTTSRTISYANKVVYLLNDLNRKNSHSYMSFTSGELRAIQGVQMNPKIRDKGGLRIFNQNVLDELQNVIPVPRPTFSIFKKLNFRTSESFRDFSCVFARVKNNTHMIGQNFQSAPCFVFSFFSNTSNNLMYKVYFTLNESFSVFNNMTMNPSLIAWCEDPRKFNFSSPRDYDYLILMNSSYIYRVERFDGQTIEINDMSSPEFVNRSEVFDLVKSLILKEVSIEFLADNNKDVNPIDFTLFSFGSMIQGGLPLEFNCYQQ